MKFHEKDMYKACRLQTIITFMQKEPSKNITESTWQKPTPVIAQNYSKKISLRLLILNKSL